MTDVKPLKYLALAALAFLSAPTYGGHGAEFGDFLYPSAESIQLPQLPRPSNQEFENLKSSGDPLLSKEGNICGLKVSAADFRKFDLSGDGLADIVFSSYCGSEEIRNYIWTQTEKTYQFAGIAEGTPLKFFREKEGEPYLILVSAGWCCVSYDGTIGLYKLEDQAEKKSYVLDKEIAEFSGLKVPKNRMSPVRFVVMNDNYRLRSSAEIDDRPWPSLISEATKGNITAEFNKGSRGEAISAITDSTGRVWWFVIMDSDATTSSSYFYGTGLKAGWMSSRYLAKSE